MASLHSDKSTADIKVKRALGENASIYVVMHIGGSRLYLSREEAKTLATDLLALVEVQAVES